MAKPLDQMTVAILEHRFTKEFSSLLERFGASVHACPLLEEKPLENRPELEQFVQKRLESGTYKSESEVFNKAIVALQEKEQRREEQIRLLNDKIGAGLRSLERGEGVDGETYINQLLAELDEEELNERTR